MPFKYPVQWRSNFVNAVAPARPATTPATVPDPRYLIPTVQNVISVVTFDCQLDLETIASKAPNCKYDPDRFPAVVMRTRDPSTAATIFESGKVVVTGARSERDSRVAARKYMGIIQEVGFRAKFKNIGIHDIVLLYNVGFPVYLEGIASTHHMFSSYEPELFPGLVYNLLLLKVRLIIFATGRIMITGARTRGAAYEAFNLFYPVLLEFRRARGRG
ncbi:TBP-domain-containing protein [Piedraia hortae CBS 480.64]|uniref:TBP-domain-containing protein n=1 Tax=Piedraia hortae CBS 480.64 TaxID=1314780 RepID=A0A6A7BZ43_9PEZI|nr:TBP-domain-containing protein [Piedraia hortae CBS 480.64]